MTAAVGKRAGEAASPAESSAHAACCRFARPWAPELHACYPTAFRAAARTVLLINERRGVAPADSDAPGAAAAAAAREGRHQAAGALQLPLDLVFLILAHAGRPISAWL